MAAWETFPFPLLYPFTKVVLAAPVAALPNWAIDAGFVAASTGLSAYAGLRNGIARPLLVALVSAPFLHAITLGQWSAALTGRRRAALARPAFRLPA